MWAKSRYHECLPTAGKNRQLVIPEREGQRPQSWLSGSLCDKILCCPKGMKVSPQHWLQGRQPLLTALQPGPCFIPFQARDDAPWQRSKKVVGQACLGVHISLKTFVFQAFDLTFSSYSLMMLLWADIRR